MTAMATIIEPQEVLNAIIKDDSDKFDREVDSFDLRVDEETNFIHFEDESYELTPNAEAQFVKRIKGIDIPCWKVWDKEDRAYMLQQMMHKYPTNLLMKCRKGVGINKIRGIVPINKYPMTNRDMAQYLFEQMNELRSDLKIVSYKLTDTHFEFRTVMGEAMDFGSDGDGDPFYTGIIGSNSEVTTWGMNLDAMIYRQICENGAITSIEDKPFIEKVYNGFLNDFDASHNILCKAVDNALSYSGEVLNGYKRVYKAVLTDKDLEDIMESFNGKVTESFMDKLANAKLLTLGDVANAATQISQDLDISNRHMVEKAVGDIIKAYIS